MSENIYINIEGNAQVLVAQIKKANIELDKVGKAAQLTGESAKQAGFGLSDMVNRFGLVSVASQAAGWMKDFTVSSYDAALAQMDVKNALTDLLGSSAAYEDAIRQVQSATKNTISETEAARTAFGLLDNGIAKSAEEAAQYALAGKALNSALGETASYEKFLMLLDEGSAMLLNNFNITQSAVAARQQEVIVTQGLGEEEARLTAIRQLALEKGLALADTMSEETIQRKQAAASYEDFQASFGGLVSTVEQSFGVMEKSIALFDNMAEGAEAWGGIFDNIATINEVNRRAAASLGIEYNRLNQYMVAGKITAEQWAEAQAQAAAALDVEAEAAARSAGQLELQAAMARDAAAASLELAEAELAAAGASQQALDVWAARYQGLADIADQPGGADLLDTMTGNVTPVQGIIEAIEAGMDDVDLGGSFKSVADNLASQLSGAVNQAFGRMQEVAPEGSIIAGMFEAEDPGEFGRRLMALAENGMEGLDGAWAEAFSNAAGGNPVYAGLLQSIEAGDSAAVAEEANRLLSENLAEVIATGLVENLRAKLEEQQLMQQVQAIVMEQMEGTGQEGEAAGLLGAMMGDPAAVAADINDNLKPAVDDLKNSLGGLGENMGGAAAGGEGEEAEAGSGGGLSSILSLSEQLATMFAETLPANILLTQDAGVVLAGEMVTALQMVQTETTTQNDMFLEMTDTTLPNLQTQSQTVSEEMVTHWGNIKKASETARDTIVDGMTKAKDKVVDLIEKVEDAAEAFRKMAEAAREAARAASSAGDADPSGRILSGGRASGGPVNAGSLYLVGERGPELFSPTTSGMIIPYRDSAPAAISAGSTGGGLTIQNLNVYGVQDARGLFEEISKVAKSKGLQFSPVM